VFKWAWRTVMADALCVGAALAQGLSPVVDVDFPPSATAPTGFAQRAESGEFSSSASRVHCCGNAMNFTMAATRRLADRGRARGEAVGLVSLRRHRRQEYQMHESCIQRMRPRRRAMFVGGDFGVGSDVESVCGVVGPVVGSRACPSGVVLARA
jgi:hypothetical protein